MSRLANPELKPGPKRANSKGSQLHKRANSQLQQLHKRANPELKPGPRRATTQLKCSFVGEAGAKRSPPVGYTLI